MLLEMQNIMTVAFSLMTSSCIKDFFEFPGDIKPATEHWLRSNGPPKPIQFFPSLCYGLLSTPKTRSLKKKDEKIVVTLGKRF